MTERCDALPPVNQGSTIMHATFNSHYNPLIRKLESIFALTDDERNALQQLPIQVCPLRPIRILCARATTPPGRA
jgi:hypothetical protein